MIKLAQQSPQGASCEKCGSNMVYACGQTETGLTISKCEICGNEFIENEN